MIDPCIDNINTRIEKPKWEGEKLNKISKTQFDLTLIYDLFSVLKLLHD